MKKAIILFTTLFFISCSTNQKYIYYCYNQTTITRVDKGNHIFFYYGKYKNEKSLPTSYIEESYSGFDGGMNAFLIIRDDGKAEIVPAGGSFKAINIGNNLILNRFESNKKFIDWQKNIKGNYLNVCRLSDAIKVEVRLNKENRSKIKAIYP
jgi:hypothetical protein